LKKRCSELESKCGWVIHLRNLPHKSHETNEKLGEIQLRDVVYKKKQSNFYERKFKKFTFFKNFTKIFNFLTLTF